MDPNWPDRDFCLDGPRGTLMQGKHVKSGPRVGKQTETMPTEHSMIHQVQAVAKVQVVSEGTNRKSVTKR